MAADIIFSNVDADTGPDSWAKLGSQWRASRARGIFADNLDEKGRLDEPSFYKAIAQAGLGADDAKTAMEWAAAGRAADVDTARKNLELRMGGYDPTAAGRNKTSVGEPEPVYVPNPAAQPAQPAAPVKGALETWWDNLRGNKTEQAAAAPQAAPAAAPLTPEAQAQVQAQQAAPSGAAQAQEQPSGTAYGQLGSSSLATATLPPLPEGAGASPMVLAPGQDRRTARQLVEDSYRPENSMIAKATGGTAGAAPDESAFEWNAQDNGSNQFQQFASALGAKLKSIGAVDPQGNPDPKAYLKQVYASTVRANMPTPPNPALLSQGLDGQVKYMGELNAFQAGMTKAQGLADQAVLKAKTDLTEYAKQYGVDTVEQAKSEVPGALLSDPAKRNEYSALTTNKTMIPDIVDALNNAKSSAEIMMVAPQVFRAASTALNPGQQLSEGNLAEQAAAVFPDLKSASNMPLLVGAIAAALRGDSKPLTQLIASVNTLTPDALRARLLARMHETSKANDVAISNYIRKPATQPAPAATPTAAPTAPAQAAPVVSPEEAKVDKEAELARLLGITKYQRSKQPKPAAKPKAAAPASNVDMTKLTGSSFLTAFDKIKGGR